MVFYQKAIVFFAKPDRQKGKIDKAKTYKCIDARLRLFKIPLELLIIALSFSALKFEVLNVLLDVSISFDKRATVFFAASHNSTVFSDHRFVCCNCLLNFFLT